MTRSSSYLLTKVGAALADIGLFLGESSTRWLVFVVGIALLLAGLATYARIPDS